MNKRLVSVLLISGVLIGFNIGNAAMEVNEESTVVAQKDDDTAKSVEIADLPIGITSFGAAQSNGKIYVYGGHCGEAHQYYASGQNATLYSIDLKKPTEWKELATDKGRQGLAVVAHGGTIYRLGGFEARNKQGEEQNLHSVNEFSRFDVEKKKWVQLQPMPETRSSFDAVVDGDWLYVVGGWALAGEGNTEWADSAFRINLANKDSKWEALTAPPFRRRAISVGVINGKVYAIGGMQQRGGPTTKVSFYDTKSKTWGEGPSLPGGEGMEGFGSSCFNVGGKLVVSTYSGQVYQLNDKGDEWTKITELDEGRFFHRLLPINNSQFVLLGGANMESGKRLDSEVLSILKSEGTQ